MLNFFKKNNKHLNKIVVFILIASLYILPFEIFAEPEKPINTSPADTATNISLTPTLTSSSYSNPADNATGSGGFVDRVGTNDLTGTNLEAGDIASFSNGYSTERTTFDGVNESAALGSLSQTIQSISYWIKPDTDDKGVMRFATAPNIYILRNSYMAGMTNQTTYVNGALVAPLSSEKIMDEKSRIFSGAGTQRWTNLNFASFNTTNDLSLSSALQYKFAYITYANAGVTIGKTYMIEFDCVLTSGQFQLKEQTIAGANQKVIKNNVVNGHNAYVWTPAVPSGGVIGLLSMTTGTDTADFDNFTIKEINKVTTAGVWNNVIITTDTPITASQITLGISVNEGVGLTYYGGEMDEVAIWNKQLSLDEASEIYNSGVPANLMDHTAISNLESYWRMGEEVSHTASQWQITDTSGDYSSPVYDSGEDVANLESINIPPSTLSGLTTYYWRVKYKDEDNVWSDWSDETSFTTETDVVGSLSADIVDAGGITVGSPSAQMNSQVFSFSDQTSTGTFGTSSQKIRVDNGTGTSTWTLSLAASGTTDFWDSAGTDYDFNDPTASAVDGADADSLGGQMTINPSGVTITPEGGCTTTNISGGGSTAFSEGVTDSITLASASSGADTDCYWDLTDISISQTIPAEQPADNYSIDMTLSIIAS